MVVHVYHPHFLYRYKNTYTFCMLVNFYERQNWVLFPFLCAGIRVTCCDACGVRLHFNIKIFIRSNINKLITSGRKVFVCKPVVDRLVVVTSGIGWCRFWIIVLFGFDVMLKSYRRKVTFAFYLLMCCQ